MIQNCKTQLQQTMNQCSLLLDKTYQKPNLKTSKKLHTQESIPTYIGNLLFIT